MSLLHPPSSTQPARAAFARHALALALVGGAVFGLPVSSASAHGLDVVAQRAGSEVSGLARYSDQSPAANVAVEVFEARGGTALVEGATDGEGRFQLAVPAGTPAGGLRVVVEGEEGHRAETLTADVAGTPSAAPDAPLGAAAAAPSDEAALRMLSVVREDVARLERELRFRDIVGGIGYLVGLAGAAAWWMARRRN